MALAVARSLPPPPEYQYNDLAGFMKVYLELSRYIVTIEDFERVVVEHGEAMRRQNITYAEVSVNPSLHEGDGWLEGITRGRRRVLDELGVEIAWLVELVRGAKPAANERVLDIAVATDGAVGLGLVGDESIAGSHLKPIIDRARKAGLGFMPHAGRAGGPDVVREALGLGATRIAHGVAATRDRSLLQALAHSDVCLCVCPSSNARIGLRPDYQALAKAGIMLTVNTDDPAMVPTTLLAELALAADVHGLNREALLAAAWKHRFGSA